MFTCRNKQSSIGTENLIKHGYYRSFIQTLIVISVSPYVFFLSYAVHQYVYTGDIDGSATKITKDGISD